MIHEIALAFEKGLISRERAEELVEAYFAQQSKWWSADFGMNIAAVDSTEPSEPEAL